MASRTPNRRLRAYSLLVAGLALAIPITASAGSAWTSGGPYGGGVFSIAVDPVSPTTVYAGMRQLMKSTDGGQSWFATGLGSLAHALAIDPSMPTTLYAGTDAGLFKSTDGGVSWASSSSGLQGDAVWALAINPLAPATVNAAGTQGLYRSTDAGASWLPVASLSSVSALAIDPVTPSTVYATRNAESTMAVWRSTNSGQTWSFATGATPAWLRTVAVDGHPPATVYIGSSGQGVSRSTDGGASWTPTGPGLPSASVVSLTVDPAHYGTVYAVTTGGLAKSTDSGASWAGASAGLQDVVVVSVAPQDPSRLYAGTYRGFFRSTNAGGAWTVANTGLRFADVRSLAVDPTGVVQYAATATSGHFATYSQPFRSTDRGKSWTPLIIPGPGTLNGLSDLTIDPATPSTVYATEWGGSLHKSTDWGESWTAIGWLGWKLALAPSQPSTLYHQTIGPLLKSTDAGNSWSELGWTLGGAWALAVHPAAPGTVYAGTSNGVFVTTDGGATWSSGGLQGVTAKALAVDPVLPSTVFAGGHGGAFKSTDGGLTWAPSGLSRFDVSAFAMDPSHPGTLYASANLPGAFVQFDKGWVFRSTDGGGSWSRLGGGLSAIPIAALALIPGTPSTLFVARAPGSVWQAAPPPAFVKGDFDADEQADVLFRSTVDGTRHKAWLMNGVQRLSEAVISPDGPGAEWRIRGVDDFDGDGLNDLVFRNELTGEVRFWAMNGATRTGAPAALTGAPVLDPGWELAATADLDHDSQPDLVWRNSTSQKLVIWTMNGTAKAGSIVPTPSQAAAGNWAVVAARDYDHDGNADFLWYNATSGRLVTWYMDANVVRTSGQFTTPPNAGDNNWKVVASADYSGASGPGTPPLGSADVVWRNQASGNQVVWHMDFASTRVHGEFTSPPANTPALDWTVVGPR